MTLEALIGEARALGLRINNLYELDSGRWRANLRVPAVNVAHCAEYGEADTPQEALRDAIQKCRKLVEEHKTAPPAPAPAPPPAAEPDAGSIFD